MNKYGHNQYKRKTRYIMLSIIIGSSMAVIGFAVFHTNFIKWVEAKTAIMDYQIEEIKNAPIFLLESTMEDKLEELKNEVRNKIMSIESANIIMDKGELFVTFDPPRSMYEKCRRIGGRMDLECLSFGPLQFKIPTIIYFEEKLNGLIVTEKEALEIAHNIELASKLFDDIVYGEVGGISNWSASLNDWEYYAYTIPIIRKLMY